MRAVLDVEQNADRCAVKVNGMLVPKLVALNVAMTDEGTIATLVLNLDEVKIHGELARLLGGPPPPDLVQELV